MNVEILEFVNNFEDNATSIIVRVKKTNGKTTSEICKEVIKHFREIIKIVENKE